MQPFDFELRTRVIFGAGLLSRLGALAAESGFRRTLLVSDPGIVASGIADRAGRALRASGIEVVLFQDFDANPDEHMVDAGRAAAAAGGIDSIVAVGGGSSLDCAKGVNFVLTNGGWMRDYRGYGKASRPMLPMIGVPTTAGTGSEATHFAVVYVDRQKYSLAHEVLLPTHAIIDPLLTHSLPPRITAASGLDALCQAIESMWAVGATDESLDYATCALRLAIDHLEAAVRNPTPPARRAMAEAAHLAGKAINISKTTAPHAFSYALTTQCNVPHGMAVALTIGPLFVYNSRVEESDCLDPRGAAHVRARIAQAVELLGAASPVDAHHRLESLLRAVGCPTRLQAHGIAREDYGPLIEQVNVERLANNPRALDGAALAKLLLTIE